MSAVVGRLFLFASNIGFTLSVGRTEVRPTSLRMAAIISVASPADLLRVKSVELLIWIDNSLICCKIRSIQSLNKSVSPNKRM